MRALWVAAVVASISVLSQPAEAEIKLTLVGTGGGPNVYLDRLGPGILVEAGGETLLFDSGRAVTLRLTELGVPLNEVRKVFLTHLHADHIIGLSDLYLTPLGRTNPEQRRITPFEVWGPIGTGNLMTHLGQAHTVHIELFKASGRIVPEGLAVLTQEIEEGVVYQNNGVTVTAFVVEHARPGTAFGYRVDYGEYSVALSGDTRFSENLIEFSQGVDVLVHEGMVADHPAIRGHTSFAEAGEVFSQVDPRLAVFYHATSMTPNSLERTRERFSGRVVDGTDMMTIQIGESVDVYPYAP